MRKIIKSIAVALSLGMTVLFGTLVPAMAYTPTETYAATVKKESTCSITPSITVKKGETKNVNISFNSNGTGNVYTVAWGHNPTYVNTNATKGFGSYWGEPGKCSVTGKKDGTTYITAYIKIFKSKKDTTLIKQMTLKCKVNVTGNNTQNTLKKIPNQSVTMSKTSGTLNVGQSETLSVNIKPSNTTESKAVKWASNNSSIATVSNGKVTAKKAGTARISATVGNRSVYYTLKVNPAVKKNTSTKTTKINTTSGTGYVDASQCYTLLNNFRTKKNVWQWNADDKSKTYFNTKSSNTLKKLSRNAKLEATAKVRAKEIATKFSHTRPNGSRCFTAFPSCSAMGENIAAGHTSASMVTTGWIEENRNYAGQGHRRNMLDKNYNAVGIACYKSNGKMYWVQCFGRM